MANNITLNLGSGGATLAADDVSSVWYQRVKLVSGTEGSTTEIATGNGTATNAMRVTIASDTTGVLSVDDNGGSLTVDGTVTANLSATDNAVLDTIDAVLDAINAKLVSGTVIGDVNLGATDNAVLDSIATNTTGLNNCVSGNELQVDIVSGGTGSTQYAEDATHTSGDTGTMALAVRNDTLAALAGTDGDYAPLQVDANGAMYVLESNSAAILADTANMDTNLGTLAGAVSGTEMQVDLVSANVTNAGTFATQVDGAALTALQLIDNPIVAHDAAASGSTGVNMSGGYATNSIEGLTQVANADAARVVTDLNGVLVSRPHTTPEEILSERITNTGGTATALTTFGAAGANIHNYITTIVVGNTSSTNTTVDIYDGTTTSVLMTVPAPANSGAVIDLPIPLKGSANTALGYDFGTAITTGYLSLVGFSAQG